MTFDEALIASRAAYAQGFALDFGPPPGPQGRYPPPDARPIGERASFELGVRQRIRAAIDNPNGNV